MGALLTDEPDKTKSKPLAESMSSVGNFQIKDRMAIFIGKKNVFRLRLHSVEEQLARVTIGGEFINFALIEKIRRERRSCE